MAKVALVISRLRSDPNAPFTFEFEDQVFPDVVTATTFTQARADQASAAGWDYESYIFTVDEGTKKPKAP